MKRISIFLSLFLYVLLLITSFKYGSRENYPLYITFAVLGLLFLSYFYFEKSAMGPKEIAVIATLGSFAAVSRIPFAVIPNVQPVTFLVALTGYVFGPYEGFLIGSTSAFISNFFLGHGPWTPWQMLAWGIIGAITGALKHKDKKMPVEAFACLCFLYGFLFDWIMNLWHVIGFVKVINLQSILLVYLTGLTMDIMHAAGNFIFAIVFYERFFKILWRFKRRIEISYSE